MTLTSFLLYLQLKAIIILIYSIIATIEDQKLSCRNGLADQLHLKTISDLWRKALKDVGFDGQNKILAFSPYDVKMSMVNFFKVS